MTFSRRQFLIFGGAFSGVGLSIAAQRILGSKRTVQSIASSNATPIASSNATPIAQNANPSGIFDPPRGDARIVVISDLNSQYGSTRYEPEVDNAIALMPTWKPDLVLCGGDMVAAQSASLDRAQLQAMWMAFDRHVAAPLRQMQIPFGFTLGNHDGSGALSRNGSFVFERDRNAAAAYWNNPQHNSGLQFVDRAGFPFYYTFQQNDIFFLVWDATTARIPRDQLAWAERSLASPIAQSARMRIAIGHLPLYAVAIGRDRAGEYLNDAEQLRSLLERHHVHTYISGHHHAYYPAHKGQLQLLYSGLLGSGARQLLNSNIRPFKALTVIDVNLSTADTIYTTYNMQTMQVVDQQQLPKLIASPTEKILRQDVEWNDLSPAEQAIEYVPRR